MAITTNILPRNAGTIALAVGLTAALGAAVTGYTDFTETWGMERRTAFVHGLTMSAVVGIMAVSLVFRLVGSDALYGPAVGLATAGLFVTGFGMYLGGHVVYGFGTGVNRVAFVEGGPVTTYVEVGRAGDFPDGQMRMVEAKGMPVLMVRLDGRLHAIVDVCSHAGGPLHEGELDGDVVECPWHGSRFCVRDGALRGGPATSPQPRLEVREEGGTVEVKLEAPIR